MKRPFLIRFCTGNDLYEWSYSFQAFAWRVRVCVCVCRFSNTRTQFLLCPSIFSQTSQTKDTFSHSLQPKKYPTKCDTKFLFYYCLFNALLFRVSKWYLQQILVCNLLWNVVFEWLRKEKHKNDKKKRNLKRVNFCCNTVSCCSFQNGPLKIRRLLTTYVE